MVMSMRHIIILTISTSRLIFKKKTEPHTTGMEGKCNEIKESNAIQRVFPLLCHVINRI